MIHNFQKAVNHRRNRTLLLTDSKRNANLLEYRYEDTGETIVVPNIWYNQTNDMQSSFLLFQAEQAIEKADVWSKTPPANTSSTTITETIAGYIKQANVHQQNARFLQMGCSLSIYRC